MFYIVRHYWRLLLVQCISMMVVITVKATRILTTLAGISCIGFENDKKNDKHTPQESKPHASL